MIARIESLEVPASVRTNDKFRGSATWHLRYNEKKTLVNISIDTISNVCIVVLPRPTFLCSYYVLTVFLFQPVVFT